MNPHQNHMPPVEETVAHKADVLDWSRIAGQKCDLEYRLSTTVPSRAYCRMFLQIAAVSAVAFPVGWGVGMFLAPLLSSTLIGLACVISGAAWAMSAAWSESRVCPTNEIRTLLPGIIGRTASPPLAWLALVSTAQLDSLSSAFIYLAATLPVAVIVFDRLVTHAVHWNTANLLVSHSELTHGRAAWKERVAVYLSSEAGHSARSRTLVDTALETYATGPLWLATAFVVPSGLVALMSPDPAAPTIGLELVYASFVGLMIVAFYRSDGDFHVALRFIRILAHWFHYGATARLTPWMFQSPCGGFRQRRMLAFLVVALLSLHLTSMAAHSLRAMAPPEEEIIEVSRQDHAWLASSVAAARHFANRSLWIAPTVLFALCVAPLEFLLVGLILTGPVLANYHRQFEEQKDN